MYWFGYVCVFFVDVTTFWNNIYALSSTLAIISGKLLDLIDISVIKLSIYVFYNESGKEMKEKREFIHAQDFNNIDYDFLL